MFPLALEGVLQTYQSTTNGPSATASPRGSTAEQTKEKAKEQAQQAAGQARGALRGQVDQRSTEAGERVSTLASDVRSVGEQLREQGKGIGDPTPRPPQTANPIAPVRGGVVGARGN